MKAGWFILLAAAAALAGCGRKTEEAHAADPVAVAQASDGTIVIPPGSPRLQQIRTEPVKSAEVPMAEVVSPGRIELNANHVSRIALPVAGRVISCAVRLGDAVTKGQALMTIDSPDGDAAASAQLQSEASVTQAKSILGKAQADYDRASDLFQHNAVAKKDVQNADAAVVQAKAAVEQAEAARRQALRKLELLGIQPGEFGQKVTVHSPISGKVLELSVVPGEYRNDTTAPVMTVADLSTVWVSADVPETAIRMIRVGERIEVTLAAYPGEVFHGRVLRIADTVDPQTRTIKVQAEMDNSAGRFRPEMYGSIRHTEGTRAMPVVPVGAVIEEGGRSFVFVEQGPGRFRQTEIAAGNRLGDSLPVTKGVQAGDRIVADGAMLLKAQ